MRTAYQRELDSFVKAVSDSDFSIREVTKSAFSQARAKLNPWAFKRLNEVAVNSFYDGAPYKTWHNKRLLAVDGTRLILPKHQTIIEKFGTKFFGPKADSERSMAIGSVLYDVKNQICIDSEIDNFEKCSEIDLLLRHINYVKEGDLLLLDRFYPSIWLFYLLNAKKIDFCIRMKTNWWVQVDEFTNSDLTQTIVEFKLPKKDLDKLSAFPEITKQNIKCRLVKVVLENGLVEVLCTSLLDDKEYDQSEFGDLYHQRWGVEEFYKMLKCRVELERFSGKTARSVEQDFYAKIFLMTLCSAYAFPIDEKVKKEYEENKKVKHIQKINKTNAVSVLSNMLVNIFIRKIDYFLIYFDDIIYKTKEIIRPNRNNERIKKPKRTYSINYKPK